MNKNNLSHLEMELKKLELDTNEVKVYLSCLKLKHSSVQKIAQSAGLSRPTTYRIIGSLIKKGLVTKTENHKSSLVVAESPDEILGLLRAKKRRIEEQEREFLRIISDLKNQFYSEGQNQIATYSGQEGIQFLLDDFSTTKSSEIRVVYLNNDRSTAKKLDKIYLDIKKRIGKVSVKELNHKTGVGSHEFIDCKKLSISSKMSGTVILADKLIFIEDEQGLLIQNEKIINLAKFFFDIIWQRA